jgi:hypothetical protein
MRWISAVNSSSASLQVVQAAGETFWIGLEQPNRAVISCPRRLPIGEIGEQV